MEIFCDDISGGSRGKATAVVSITTNEHRIWRDLLVSTASKPLLRDKINQKKKKR